MQRVVLCLLLSLAVPTSGSAQLPGIPQDLAAGGAVSILLAPRHPTFLRLPLAGLDAASILLDAAVPGVSYRLTSVGGAEILSGHVDSAGWVTIPFSTVGLGQAQLQLSTESATQGLPGFHVRVEFRALPLASLSAEARASRHFAEAQMLHRSLNAADLRHAIPEYELAARVWSACGDPNAESLAWGGKAESEIELSRYASARHTLIHASRLAAAKTYLRAWLLHLSTRIHLDLWEGKGATDSAQEEMQLSQDIQDAASIALARADLAGASFWTDFSHSHAVADRARAEAMAAGVPEALGLEGKWMGWIEEKEEIHLGALEALNDSATYFRLAGDKRAESADAVELAAAWTIDGDQYSALVRFQQLEPAIHSMGNVVLYGLLLVDIGDALRQMGRPQMALNYYHKPEADFERVGYRFGALWNQQSLCEAALDMRGQALAQCRKALHVANEFGNPNFIGQSLCDLARAERAAAGDAQALRYLPDAVLNSEKDGDLREQSIEHIQLGEIQENAGNWQEALGEFRAAEELGKSITDPASLLEAQYAVARWYLQQRQYETAEDELKSALEKVEATRRSVASSALQSSYFAAVRKCYELGVELRMREFQDHWTGSADAGALALSEQSHARGLLDALSARKPEVKRERSDLEQARMKSNMVLSRVFDRRLKLLVEGGVRRDFDASSAELAQALVDMERADKEARPGVSVTPPQAAPMTADEIEEASRHSGTAYFEYELGPERSYLWVVRDGELKSYVLAARERLERMVIEWRSLAAGTERSEPGASERLRLLSARLSCALLVDAVKPGMSHMLVVPDGNLAMLPFAALPENGCSSAPGGPLVAAHEVMEAPSLSIFLSRKTQREEAPYRGTLAIVADPVFDAADSRLAARKQPILQASRREAETGETMAALSRLINTGYEATAIEDTVRRSVGTGQVFAAQGLDANLDTLLSPAMRDYRIWHVATHGIYDESMPEFSGLVLSQIARDGSPRSGFLKAHDIAGLDMRAELVVLNACDSGAGETLNGEGVMGLSYAFLRAGARQVISTLWSIDDARSKDLMVAFYKELMRNGGDAAAALRHAQLALMRQHNASNPYYWAGFELTSVGR